MGQIVSADVEVGSGAKMRFRNQKYVDVVSFDEMLYFDFASLELVIGGALQSGATYAFGDSNVQQIQRL